MWAAAIEAPLPCCGQLRPSLADAKAPEYFAEQVVGAELTGDLTERLVRKAQLFGEQLERGERLVQHALGEPDVRLRSLQCVDMARAGNEHAFGLRLPAGQSEQARAQGVLACGRQEPTPPCGGADS